MIIDTENATRAQLTKALDLIVRKLYPEVDNDFEEFWKVYPRKTAKGLAQKSYIKARAIASKEQLIAGAESARRAYEAKTPEDRKYTPMCSSWLNQRRWEDEEPDPLKQDGLDTTPEWMYGG